MAGRLPGNEIVDFWGATLTVVRVEPNHVRRAPDYLCEAADGRLVWVPAAGVRGEDMEAHRRQARELDESHLTTLEAIRAKFADENFVTDPKSPSFGRPRGGAPQWFGCEFGKALVGRALDDAVATVKERCGR